MTAVLRAEVVRLLVPLGNLTADGAVPFLDLVRADAAHRAIEPRREMLFDPVAIQPLAARFEVLAGGEVFVEGTPQGPAGRRPASGFRIDSLAHLMNVIGCLVARRFECDLGDRPDLDAGAATIGQSALGRCRS